MVANILSHSISCLFILFMIFFVEQRLVSLIRFHLFSFAFISIALEHWPKKTLVQFMSECFACVLLKEFYAVMSYISLSHLKFIFVYGERMCSNLIALIYMWLSHPPNTTWRDCPFCIVYSCLICQRLIVHKCVGWYLGFLFCYIDPYVCFGANITQFWLL